MKIKPVAKKCESLGRLLVIEIEAKARLLISGMLLCALSNPNVQAQANTKDVRAKTVLVLSGGRGRASINRMESSLKTHFSGPVNFSIVDLDNPRFEQKAYRDSLAEALRAGYSGEKLDLVVAVMTSPLEFAVQYRDMLFPGVPIVFMSNSLLIPEKMWPGVTGVESTIGARETIDLALRLQPDTQTVAVIGFGNASRDDNYWFQAEHSELVRHRDKVKEIDLLGPANPELLRRVAELPPHTVVLFQLYPEDANQPAFGALDVLAAVTERFPTYSVLPHITVGRGGVGGASYDPTIDAVWAGQLAARVLSGERPDDIPVVQNSKAVLTVDWRQLQKWHIPESALPPGTAVLYKEPTAWESYKWYIVGGVSLITLEAALIIGLMWQRARRRKTEKELSLAYDRLRMAVEAGRSVGWDTDLRKGRHRWFGDLQTVFGIQGGNYNGHLGDFRSRIHPEDLGAFERAIAEAKDKRGPYSAELRVIRLGGDQRWISAIGKFYFTPNGEPERMLGMATDITERKLAEEALNSLSGRLIQAQEEERSRIAREIHDDYQQRLAMLSIDLEDLDKYLERNSEGSDRLRELWNRVGELGSDLHSLSHRLHSSTLDNLGLVAALTSLCAEFRDYHSIDVHFMEENVPQRIPREVALCLFRITQEALQNVKKHSHAESAEVRVEGREQRIYLSISDDGAGFDPGSVSKQDGIGIRSIEERVRLVEGQFTLRSRPTEGTRIDVWVPIGG
jgi:signal transduction histidine kinase